MNVGGLDVDVGEEVGVHEGVVGLGMGEGEANIFVLLMMLGSCKYVTAGCRRSLWKLTMLKVTTFLNEISPSLYFWTRFL